MFKSPVSVQTTTEFLRIKQMAEREKLVKASSLKKEFQVFLVYFHFFFFYFNLILKQIANSNFSKKIFIIIVMIMSTNFDAPVNGIFSATSLCSSSLHKEGL